MSATPKVSVITPAYKVARYIGQAIESVQAQTLTDWEMIIVDDASPDETVQVVQRYLDDPRIKLLQNEQNMGAGYTRNRALDAAQGEWIAVLDADDWYAPQRLEKLVRFAEEWNAQMVSDFTLFVAEDGTISSCKWSEYGTNPRNPRWYTVDEVIRTHPAFKPVVIRSFLESKQIRYNPAIRQSQDYAFQVEILIKGGRFALFPEGMYYYRFYAGFITKTYSSKIHHFRQTIEYLSGLPETTLKQRKLLEFAYNRQRSRVEYSQFFSSITESIKSRDWLTACKLACANPKFCLKLARRVPSAILRHITTR